MDTFDIIWIHIAALVILVPYLLGDKITVIDRFTTDYEYVKKSCLRAAVEIFFYFLRTNYDISQFSKKELYILYRKIDSKTPFSEVPHRVSSLISGKINPKIHAGVLVGFAKYVDYRATLLDILFKFADDTDSFASKTEESIVQIAAMLNLSSSYETLKDDFFRKVKAEEHAKQEAENQARRQAESYYSGLDYALSSAYKLLGISENASADEIKSAYRKIVKLWHPDMLVNKTEHDIAHAEQRFREYTAAYDLIKQRRGIA